MVVVGDLVREGVTQENAAIGETTNLAARLQSLAEPNTLVISPRDASAGRSAVRVSRSWDTHPQGLCRAGACASGAGASKLENRFEARAPVRPSPLLGRERGARSPRAALGAGQARRRARRAGHRRARHRQVAPHASAARAAAGGAAHAASYHCSPYHQDSALYPIIGQLLRAAGIERDDGAETKLDKLEALLAQSSENLAEDVALFAALLSIPGGDRYPLPTSRPSV